MIQPKASKAPESGTFDPGEVSSQAQQFASHWATAVHEQIDKLAQASSQVAAWQKEALRRAEDANAELVRLAKSTLEYGSRLAEQMQSTSIDVARRCVDMVAPRA
jgi:hypothetical protein